MTERIERLRQGLANAHARLERSQGKPDWIAYNQRRIVKYEKLLVERLEKPNVPSILSVINKE